MNEETKSSQGNWLGVPQTVMEKQGFEANQLHYENKCSRRIYTHRSFLMSINYSTNTYKIQIHTVKTLQNNY